MPIKPSHRKRFRRIRINFRFRFRSRDYSDWRGIFIETSIAVEAIVHYQITYAAIQPIEAELLTTRQREIFHLIVAGLSNKEIARKLGLAEGTVKIHIAKLFDKLGVRHRSAVAFAGAKLGLLRSIMVFGQRGAQ